MVLTLVLLEPVVPDQVMSGESLCNSVDLVQLKPGSLPERCSLLKGVSEATVVAETRSSVGSCVGEDPQRCSCS